MVGHGVSSAGSYLADPTSPIPSHCAVIILVKGVPVHSVVTRVKMHIKEIKLLYSCVLYLNCTDEG